MTQEEQDHNEPAEVTNLWDLFIAEKFEETITEAEKYINNDANADRYTANKLIGLANFRLGNYAVAEKLFTTIAKDANTLEDWFNVLTSSTLNKHFDLSEQAFATIVEFYKTGAQGNGPSLPQVYFYYMQALRDVQEYENAFLKLSQLLQYYIQLRITDTHFLYMRGVPFLSDTLSAAKTILENSDKLKGQDLLNNLASGVDEDGEAQVKQFKSTLQY